MKWLWPILARLGSRTLLVLCGTLFVVDLIVPDPLPFVDELLLGAATLLLARRRPGRPGKLEKHADGPHSGAD